MSDYTVDFHVYGYNAEVGELISAKDAESSIVAIQADMQKDHDNEVKQLKAKVAELEQENNMLKRVEKIFNDSPDLTFNVVKKLFKDELAIRDLEQQAKGVGDFEKLFSFYDSEKDCELVYSEDAISYYAKLRKQAAKIKEQK